MRCPACATALLLAGCGRFGFGDAARQDTGAPDDTQAPDDALVDGPPDAPPPTGPFGAVMAVPSLNTGDDDDPSLTADLLEIVFDSGRTGGEGGGDMWTARRTTSTDAWMTPTALAALNTTGDDATPEISRDGLTLFWVANGAVGMKDVYYATRPDRTSPWSARVHVPQLSTSADESGPTFTPDALTLYVATNPSTDDDIYVSTRASVGAAWSTPTALALNSPTAADAEPFINGTNTLLLWSSDRGGNSDIWMARRATPQDPWGTPEAVTELNTGNAEGDPWLSPDERIIMFSRGGAIYMATR